MIRERCRLFAKWQQTQCRAITVLNIIAFEIKFRDRKNQYNQFVLSKLDSSPTSPPDFWKTVKDLLGKGPYSNAPLIRGDTVYYDMTSKAKIFTNILPPFPPHLTPYCLKYFLGFICILIYAFLLSQLSPLMFTMCYYLLNLINPKVLMTGLPTS